MHNGLFYIQPFNSLLRVDLEGKIVEVQLDASGDAEQLALAQQTVAGDIY